MDKHEKSMRKIDVIKAKMLEHASKVLETVEALNELFRASISEKDRIDQLFEKIYKLEHEADDLKREIVRELRLAYLHPLDREDLLKVITLIDDIAGYSKSASKRIVTYTKGGLELGETYTRLISKIIEESVEAVGKLITVIKSLNEGDLEALNRLVEVDEKEKRVDDMRLKLLEELYKECIAEIQAKCIILPDLVDDLESITDVCEDVGVLLKLIYGTRV
ncbi:DUF47 domain-containing protein [Thermogladius sp. 4427co]|uniref:DUF47 domain-containing protein n=1 Tax=Thermogladius sp. 4427co TaxID=3450718 RepID=UPI003F7A58B0